MTDDAWEDDDSTIPCPFCKRPIYEDSPRCPFCGNYISEEDTLPRRKPWWIMVGILAVFYVIYRWVTG